MSRRRIIHHMTFGAAFVLASANAGAQSTSTTELVVGVRTLSDKVIKYVADTGQPRSVPAPAGTDLLKLISDYCGSSNARRSYVNLFIAANADNPDIREKRLVTTQSADFTLPACLYAQEAVADVDTTDAGPQWQSPKLVASSKQKAEAKLFGQSVDLDRLGQQKTGASLPYLPTTPADPVPPVDKRRLSDDKLSSQFNSLIAAMLPSTGVGVAPEPTSEKAIYLSKDIETTLRTQDISAANGINDWTRIPSGQTIKMSVFAPGRYVYTVKEGLDSAAVAKEFPELAREPGNDIVRASDYQPYFAIPQSRHDSGAGFNDANCADPNGKPWPIDHGELGHVLKLRETIKRMPKAGRLLLLDTGFPDSKVGVNPFRKEFFIRKTASALDSGNKEYLWTAILPPHYFFEGMENAEHGIAVLSLALGGIDVLESGLLTTNLMRGDGFLIAMTGYTADQGKLALNGSAVLNTLAGTDWGRVEVDVVNMSLRFKAATDAGNAEDSVTRKEQVLYVFAAGNYGPPANDLSGKPDIVPAKWGGIASPHVITVGSVDAENRYSSFANFSRDYVDLAAPGCKVPVFSWDPAAHTFVRTTMSGTSMAAPLVSFAANMLRDDYKDAGRLKARLLGAGRYETSLAGKVRSSRVLDIAAALAVPFDIVRENDGKVHYGHVTWPVKGQRIHGALVTRDQIRQLSSADNSTVQAVYVDVRDPAKIDFQSTPLIRGDLTDIPFQEMLEQGSLGTLGPVTKRDIRTIKSITFCQTNECYWNR